MSEKPLNGKDTKTIGRLIAIIKQQKEVTIHLISSPETVVTGVLDSFDSDGTHISILVIHNHRGFRFINWNDVSLIEENISEQN